MAATRDFSKLAQAMYSLDLVDSHWTQELPRLPVPDLMLTMTRYLASLKAVLCPATTTSTTNNSTGGESSASSSPSVNQPQQQQQLDEDSCLVKASSRLPLGCGLSREQAARMRKQFERTQQIVREFMLNQGPQLQRDLKEYANKCQNWATEYWLQDMYLSNALPLPVNSNPFFMFPRQTFQTSEQMLMFATRIIQFSVDFKYHIDQQTLKQDFGSGQGKGKPLCMETYKNFFHSYRMPHEDMDRLLPQSRRSNHIVVASCNQFYILRLGQDPLDDPYRKDPGSLMNEATIFDQLLCIYRSSRERAKRELLLTNNNNNNNNNNKQNGTPIAKIPRVGLFTTENRKVWAKIHKKLSHCTSGSSTTADAGNGSATVSGNDREEKTPKRGETGAATSLATNIESLKLIEDCLFVMCLDSLVHPAPAFASMCSQASQQPTVNAATNHISAINHTHSGSSLDNNTTNQTHNQAAAKGSDGDEDVATADDGSSELVRAASIILTGGGWHLFTANRWFDKFLQIIVGRDGICGINIEHSASEGITVLRFLEDFLQFIKTNPIQTINMCKQEQEQNHYFHQGAAAGLINETSNSFAGRALDGATGFSCSVGGATAGGGGVVASELSLTSPGYVEPKSPRSLLQESDKITPLSWILDKELEEAIEEAECKANKLIDNFSLHVLEFTKFGRQFIKKQQFSPDAFIQLAMQYTFYKLHGYLVSTYESASLRQFRLGRVDNIRANTCEAYEWIQAMLSCKQNSSSNNNTCSINSSNNQDDPKTSLAYTKFLEAITKQVEILRYTIVGGAPDNHLLALRQLARIRYYDDELPDLFTDPSYGEFLNFRLSTSQLPNESGILVGYGAVTPDGYGCSYNPCQGRIIFCISSFANCPQTNSHKFAEALKESLLEMEELCLSSKGKGNTHTNVIN